jgi:hypothetical protein
MSVEKEVQSLGIESPLLVLDYLDSRASQAKAEAESGSWLANEASRYEDPYHVWSQKVFTFKLAGKTLGRYLADALVFDMLRVKLPVAERPLEAPAFQGTFDKEPFGQRFVLGVEVLTFRPTYKMGFANVKPAYSYVMRARLWDGDAGRVIMDETIDRRIETPPVPQLPFAEAIDNLMNDRLTEVNMEIIKAVALSLGAAEENK